MTVIIAFSDGDAIPFESKYTSLDKAILEILSLRFIKYDNKLYCTSAIVKVGEVA